MFLVQETTNEMVAIQECALIWFNKLLGNSSLPAKQKHYQRMDGLTDKPTNGPTDGHTLL